MNPWLVVAAALAGVTGTCLLYLASPQQQWRALGPWPRWHRAWPGTLCLLLSLLLLWPTMGPLEAVSAWLALLMLVGSLAPFLGAWRARLRGNTR
jgi:hypothetical protein